MMDAVKVKYGDDVAYVRLTERPPARGEVAATKEVAPGLYLDLDAAGEAVGLEILGLKRRGLAQGAVAVEVDTTEYTDANDPEARRLKELLEAAGAFSPDRGQA